MSVILLDTHVWIWAVEGDTWRVGPKARRLLSKAEADDGIRISTITLFEVAALHTRGRIRLTQPLDQWIGEALDSAGVRLAELSAAAALDAGRTPRAALADPLDRLLVASARDLEATFLTGDAAILQYAASVRDLRVQDAGA